MKKILGFSFAVLSFLFLSAFDFSGYSTPPKSRTSGGITIYYYDLRTPKNRSGLIPASGKHYLERPDLWTSLANGAKAYKNTVWNQVAAWENQSRPADSIIIKQRDLNWTGNLQSSIDAAINSIKKQYPQYDIKEVMVYPVHYPRTYPVSAADALMLMAEDEYQKSSKLDLEIDMGFSTVPKIERPFGGGIRSTVWDTRALYFPTPPFKASDGKIYTFNNIKEVFTPINGKTPWLDGPGFWSNWAVAGYSQGKGLKYLVENGIWYGRAHPVLYTPGNDPYMRTMIYPDWSYIQSELVNGYLYFDWAAMVSDNDYKIEAILYKKNSTPPPPPVGGKCNAPVIIGGELRYQYEIDLAVTKIEGKTVDQNSNTQTPVTVYREDFSAKRAQVRNEIESDKAKAENEKAQLEAQLSQLKNQKAQLESQLSKAESDKAKCEAQPPDKNGNPPNCSSYDSQIANLQAQINAKQTEIDNKECEIATKDAEIKGYQKELDDLTELENQYRVIDTNVLLTFNGSSKGNQPVSLQEGESKVLTFNWKLPSNGTVKAEINPYRDYDEVTYANNSLDTPIYIATWEMSTCGTSSSVSAIVATEKNQTVSGSTSSRIYREYYSGSILNLHPRRLRAGYGFTYTAQTNYSNEYTPSMTGVPNAAEAEYSYAAEAIDDTVQSLDLISTNGYLSTFQPKQYYVAKHSGLVFDSPAPSSPQYDPNDPLINGGRKWYSPFEQKDGIYPFDVEIGRVGVNHLGVCLRDQVEIKGTAMDDFVKRSVLPDNPFPAQSPGWNWIGKESIITKLKDWFYNKQ